jgi:hypothetical protein
LPPPNGVRGVTSGARATRNKKDNIVGCDSRIIRV